MNTIFSPLLRRGVLVFIDDILCHSETLEAHVQLLKEVFRILAKKSIEGETKQMHFCYSEIEIPGTCHW